MALPRKTQSDNLAKFTGRYPETFPELPRETVVRFPGVAEWHKQIEKWWYDTRSSILRDLNDLADSIQALRSECSAYRTLNDSVIAGLIERIELLEGASTGSITDINLELTELATDLSAHIASTIVHGTVSDVVGLTDNQNLEDKRIGYVTPDYGRFTHSISSNVIPATESLYIPLATNMVVAGTYSVYGTLIVDGSVAFV